MKVIHSDEPLNLKKDEFSVFLAGPTPRSENVPSWRPQAIEILENLGFNGTVLVPEKEDWKTKFDYQDQVDWEYKGLKHCSVIVFWVPRVMETMPALTTNVEFGFWLKNDSHKIIYGRPQGAVHTRYLDWLYKKMTKKLPKDTLKKTLKEIALYSK